MIIEMNHGVAGFYHVDIKDILYYISTIWILILSIFVYFNKCTVTDQVVCMNKEVLQQLTHTYTHTHTHTHTYTYTYTYKHTHTYTHTHT